MFSPLLAVFCRVPSQGNVESMFVHSQVMELIARFCLAESQRSFVISAGVEGPLRAVADSPDASPSVRCCAGRLRSVLGL
eukprot:JP441693.1.p3 GENE.JP441693.1~~JP441693.1.p3  ORF type:complete len:80 (-),score=3.67 JP441693.1:61-300(-)